MDQVNLNVGDQIPASIVERLYSELSNIVGAGVLTTSNVVTVIISLMQLVEVYPELNGAQKKACVLRVIHRFVGERMGNTQEARDLLLLVDTTLPTLIDTIVAIDTHKIKVKTKKCCKKLFACCN